MIYTSLLRSIMKERGYNTQWAITPPLLDETDRRTQNSSSLSKWSDCTNYLVIQSVVDSDHGNKLRKMTP